MLKYCLLAILICARFGFPSTHAQETVPTAEALLKKMAATYAAAKTYSDYGVVYSHHNSGRDPTTTSFRTYYSRPDYLRFDMTNNVGSPFLPADYKVLWSNSTGSYSWWQSLGGIMTNRDVVMGVNGFTGISSRSVHNIPSLLQRNFGWQEYLNEITAPVIAGEEVYEKTACYRIRGGGKGSRQFELWLGKADNLLRKIKTTYPTFWEEEIHYEITIDQTISPDVFEFIPPKPK